ncbi:Integrin-linked protein kinase family [Zea mays]|jgi:hypothetical protein|uniref:Integrin-linked protein kinase family n=1 Tax=Zea mays TaxID=4577 RepID=A0A1D6N550_MAIZE|nr:Integrin-linked protein kinase family [Zea mays]
MHGPYPTAAAAAASSSDDMAANGMKVALHRQVSGGSMKQNAELRRQASLESPRTGRATSRFLFGRQSSMDPNRRRGRSQSPVRAPEDLGVPDNLDATMQLLFFACQGDALGIEGLLRSGVDVNSINLDGRTALHIAACEGHRDVVRVLISWKANIDARDRWGSTVSLSRPRAIAISLSSCPHQIDFPSYRSILRRQTIRFASLIVGSS